jgi:hypothetical protein
MAINWRSWRRRPAATLAAAGVIVAVLIGAGIAIAIVAGSRDVELLDEGSPEGVVQRYLLALESGDTRAAYGYLGGGAQDRYAYGQFVESTRWQLERDIEASLLGTSPLDDGRVEVRVRVTEFSYSPPFGADEWSQRITFILEREGEEWRLSDPPWPLPSYLPRGLDVPAVPPVPALAKPAVPAPG